MFFDKRVFLVASLLQSVATVDGRKAQQELVRDGPTKTEGCGQDRCAQWNIPTDWSVPFETASSLKDRFGYYDCDRGRNLQPGIADLGGCSCDEDTGDAYCSFTTPYFNELEWTTRLDKDALCQICLSPPQGNTEELLSFMRENSAAFPLEEFLNYWQIKFTYDKYDYVVDSLDCAGLTYDIERCQKCVEDFGFGFDLISEAGTYENPFDICYFTCFTPISDEVYGFSGEMYLIYGEDYIGFESPPRYKRINKLFWSEDASQPNTGDDYYCANRFQNYVDPCCLESSAPSVKPTLPPTSILGFAGSLAPTTASDDNPCFSDSATVEVQGKGKVTMKSLLVGDVVLTPSGYEKVYTIDHRSEEKPTDFIQIHTEVEDPLEVTGTHLIFKVGKNDPVEARSIVVGDELQGYFNGEMKSVVVEKITSISKNGLYNPITTSGTIVVDGLVTSTYTAVNLSEGSNYLTIGGYKVLSMHDFMHMAMIPFKTICMALSDSSFCTVSGGNEHNSYNQIGLSVMAYGKSQNIYVQHSIVVALITLFLIVNILSTPAVLVSLILFKTMKKGTKIE